MIRLSNQRLELVPRRRRSNRCTTDCTRARSPPNAAHRRRSAPTARQSRVQRQLLRYTLSPSPGTCTLALACSTTYPAKRPSLWMPLAMRVDAELAHLHPALQALRARAVVPAVVAAADAVTNLPVGSCSVRLVPPTWLPAPQLGELPVSMFQVRSLHKACRLYLRKK